MTDELKPCLAHPCDGVMKPNTYDASLTCSACQFQVADESEYSALVAGRQAAIDDEKQNPWKAAIIQELIVDNILTEELERDPRKALAVAIDWNCKVALDPSASAEARALQQAAIDAALEDIEGALNADGRYDSADFVRLHKGSNPLAEAQARIDALEKQRASLFKEGAEAAAIAAERIAELEGKLRSADGLAKFNSNLFTEQARRIAELECELAEARAAIKVEREACAGICDSLSVNGIKADPTGWCAETIRRRSERHAAGGRVMSKNTGGPAFRRQGQMSTETERFVNWYQEQQAKGLVDIKFFPGDRAMIDRSEEKFFKELNQAIAARDARKIVERPDVF